MGNEPGSSGLPVETLDLVRQDNSSNESTGGELDLKGISLDL